MLACLVMQLTHPPVLIAVVNPADGTAWRQDGSATECPLSSGLVEKESEHADGSDANTHRLFVFSKENEKTSRQWDGTPLPKEGDWNPLFPVLLDGKDSRYLVFDRKVTPEETAIDVSVDYTIEPPRRLIDLSFHNGIATIHQGSEFHPKVFTSLEGMLSAAPRNESAMLRRWWTSDIRSVLRYDWPYRGLSQMMSHVLSTSCASWVKELNMMSVLDKEESSTMYIAYRQDPFEFRHFSMESQSCRTAQFRHVVVRPESAGGKP